MDESVRQYYDLINQQQQQNNAWSAEQAQKAMDYQTQMSNTAHQREVADLKAAGLNPVLSAGTQGATTGTGHAAQAGNENVTALYGLLSKAFDAQLAQAEAMKSSAKAASGASGSYNPVGLNNRTSAEEAAEAVISQLTTEERAKLKFTDNVEKFLSSGPVGVALDRVQRLTGIKTKNLIEACKWYVDTLWDAEQWYSNTKLGKAIWNREGTGLFNYKPKEKKILNQYNKQGVSYGNGSTVYSVKSGGSAKINYSANRSPMNSKR